MKNFSKLCLLVAVISSFNTGYAYDFEMDGIFYTLLSPTELTCEVTSGETKYSGDIIIPTKVQYGNKTLSVVSIGDRAFYECTDLQSIEIPNSVTEFGISTFYNCSALQSIEIPNSVTNLGGTTFGECTSLQLIKLPNSVKRIGSSLFFGCSSLQSIEIPNSVIEIGSYAFSRCSSLQSIEIPYSVIKIESYAFSRCSSLQSIEIPNSVTILEENAFAFCSALRNIKLSDNLSTIAYGTFYDCNSLETLNIPNSVEKIVQCHRSINKSHTFAGCQELKNIIFEYDVSILVFGEMSNYGYDRKHFYETSIEDWTNSLETVFIDRRLNKEMTYLKELRQLTIGRNLDVVDMTINKSENLTTIISYATIPPELPTCTHSQYINLIVKVPEDALGVYQQTKGWKEFWNLEGAPSLNSSPSGVENITFEKPEKVETGRYDLNGRPVSDAYKGIVIIRYSDGSTKKVMNK